MHLSGPVRNQSMMLTCANPVYKKDPSRFNFPPDGLEMASSIQYNTLGSNSPRVPGERLTLVVDETRFVVDVDLLRKQPNTMLGR